jgi:hypothetical protein
MPREAGYRHHQETRDRIQAQQLINRLQAHVDSDKPLLDASQVNAAKALLNKVLPDLSAVSVEGEMRHSADETIQGLLTRVATAGQRLANDGST